MLYTWDLPLAEDYYYPACSERVQAVAECTRTKNKRRLMTRKTTRALTLTQTLTQDVAVKNPKQQGVVGKTTKRARRKVTRIGNPGGTVAGKRKFLKGMAPNKTVQKLL